MRRRVLKPLTEKEGSQTSEVAATTLPVVAESPRNAKKQTKSPAPRRQREQTKEAIVLLPLTFNDGSEVPESLLADIRDQIFILASGYTIEGTVKGAYRMASGEKKVEESVKISIVLRQADIPRLKTMMRDWAADLGQETLILKVADYEVKFIQPSRGEEQP